MVQINPTYPLPPAPIASFDFEDVAEGTGVVIFFGISSETSGGVDYHLVANKAFSSQPDTTRSTSGTTTIDFDTGTFNLPRTAKGTAYFSAAIGGTTDQARPQLKVQIFHVDAAAAETNITSEITSQEFAAPSGVGPEMVFLELPITQKHFAKGEFIRLRVKLVTTTNTTAGVGHDPNNQDPTFTSAALKITTVMELQMPFRIDI